MRTWKLPPGGTGLRALGARGVSPDCGYIGDLPWWNLSIRERYRLWRWAGDANDNSSSSGWKPRRWASPQDIPSTNVKEEEKQAVYANRRRIKGRRGRELSRRCGEKVECTFVHCYETGGMRRTHLLGYDNIRKRLLVHIVGFNLGVLLRRLYGSGTPRALLGLLSALERGLRAACSLLNLLLVGESRYWPRRSSIRSAALAGLISGRHSWKGTSARGC
jgi:hypothetical protein